MLDLGYHVYEDIMVSKRRPINWVRSCAFA